LIEPDVLQCQVFC